MCLLLLMFIILWCFIGKDHEEGCVKDGMHWMQIQETAGHQEMQTLWARRWQEEEGTVLLSNLPAVLFTGIYETSYTEIK